MHRRSRFAFVLVACALGSAGAGHALADGPGDNLPDRVRPIPPPGIELDAQTQAALLDAAAALARDVEATPAADVDRAEVLVFARAVRRAVEDRFLYAPQQVEQARSLLALARERLAALAGGAKGAALIGATAPAAPRLVVGGFRSRLDGSVQPYGLVIPAGIDLADGRPRRLDVSLHGRGEKSSEVAFLTDRLQKPGEIAPADAIVLHPYGRYCNAFKFAGEVDVLEAIAHVKAILPIDDRRIVIRGFSMGGAGCWQLAVHYPGTWLAATPGAGFSETREFLRFFQGEEFVPSAWQAPLLEWYDCPGWANNLRTLPVIAYSGETDKQKQASDVMVAACRQRGFEIPYVIGPQTGHKIHPDSLAEIERFLAAKAVAGRPDVPQEIDFTTYTLRYPRHSWLTIEGLGRHWQEARVQAALRAPRGIEITTTNVTGLRLALPTASRPLDFAGPIEVRIDGETLTVPQSDAAPTWTATFTKQPGGWRLATDALLASRRLRKRPGLQGPIDDAFLEPFIFVGPDPDHEATLPVDVWVKEEYARATREWARHFRGDVIERKPADVTAEDVAGHNLILFGTPDSNPLVRRVMPGLPLRTERLDWVIGTQRAGQQSTVPVLIYPNPLNPERYVVLNSGFTFREYAYLNNARQIPMLPDWAFVRVDEGRGAQRPGTIEAAGFFDEAWRP